MKEIGSMIKGMAKDLKYFKREILMKDHMKMEKLMERGNIFGFQEIFMMDNGFKEKKMDMVYGKE